MEYERIKPWEYIVVSVASDFHKRFDMCDLDDIKQSLYIWFLEHPNKLDTWEAIGKQDAKNLIYRSLRNQALDYCQAEKAKTLGYETQDLFYYTPEMIENLLPAVLRDDSNALPTANLDTPNVQGNPAESGNLVTMLAEIQLGYGRLHKDDKKVLLMRFGLGFGFPEIQMQMELNTEDAARMRVRRAIKRLIIKSGGFRPQKDRDDAPPLEERPITPESETTPEL